MSSSVTKAMFLGIWENARSMALNAVSFSRKVVSGFLRYQVTAYAFSDDGPRAQLSPLLSLEETRETPLYKSLYYILGILSAQTMDSQLNEEPRVHWDNKQSLIAISVRLGKSDSSGWSSHGRQFVRSETA